MRRDFQTQVAAQAFADAIHSRMIAADATYADSVSKGHTKAWAIPYQDLDENEKPTGPWWVNLKPRVNAVIRTEERAALKPFKR